MHAVAATKGGDRLVIGPRLRWARPVALLMKIAETVLSEEFTCDPSDLCMEATVLSPLRTAEVAAEEPQGKVLRVLLLRVGGVPAGSKGNAWCG